MNVFLLIKLREMDRDVKCRCMYTTNTKKIRTNKNKNCPLVQCYLDSCTIVIAQCPWLLTKKEKRK